MKLHTDDNKQHEGNPLKFCWYQNSSKNKTSSLSQSHQLVLSAGFGKQQLHPALARKSNPTCKSCRLVRRNIGFVSNFCWWSWEQTGSHVVWNMRVLFIITSAFQQLIGIDVTHMPVSGFSTSWTTQTGSSGFLRAEVHRHKGQQILQCTKV